jgi:hypothetical protein
LAGQGKAHHENDDPLHVWPTCFASCPTKRTARAIASSICRRHFPITAFCSRIHMPEIMVEMGKAERGRRSTMRLTMDKSCSRPNAQSAKNRNSA